MAKKSPLKDAHAFAGALQTWFDGAKRPLPWRDTYDPYRVWISEIMLQQTQMERGVTYFNDWMRRFPDIQAVADAEPDAILAAWEGLGYYSRARNLHAAAKRIMAEHGGLFPRSPDAIRRLPGVGGYTAGAILSIAFNAPEPAVDANVLRIFARILDIDAPISDGGTRKRITDAVRALMPEDSPRRFNQALMELGALVCGKTARCGGCPVRDWCGAHAAGTVASRPVREGKKEYRERTMAAGLLLAEGRLLVLKRPSQGLWAGMWEFPAGDVAPGEAPEEAVLRLIREQTGAEAAVTEKLATVRHGYTTNRVTLDGFICAVLPEENPACPDRETRWVDREESSALAFPAGHRKLLERFGWKIPQPSKQILV